MGLTTFILALLLGIGGISANMAKIACNCKWNTKKMLSLGTMHKYFAYFVIVASQATMVAGFLAYDAECLNADCPAVMLGYLNVGFFILVWALFEIFH